MNPPRLLRLLRPLAAVAALALGFRSPVLRAAEHPVVELLRWDGTNLRPDAFAITATDGNAAAEPAAYSGIVVVGPGLQRSAEQLERRLVVEFITRGPAFPGGVAESLESGEYIKFVVRGAPGRELSLTEFRVWVGVSAPKLKVVLVTNRTGLGDRDRLAFTEPEPRATEISKPSLMWRGGTRYTFDLTRYPKLQHVPADETIEFYLVPVDVESRYAFWGVSAKHEAAVAISGFESR